MNGTRRGSCSAAPPAATSERFTSGTPNRAFSAATIRSQASSSSNPPASAQPSTAPISGLRGGVWVMPHSPRPSIAGVSPRRKALRSIPAENVPPGPGQHADPEVVGGVQLVDGGGDALGDGPVEGVLRLAAG